MRANGIDQGLPHSHSKVVSAASGAAHSPVHTDVGARQQAFQCTVSHAQVMSGW